MTSELGTKKKRKKYYWMFILIYQFYGQRDARTIEAAAVAVSALCRVCLWPKIAFRSEVTGSGVQTGQRHYSVYTTLAVVSMDWLSTVTDCVHYSVYTTLAVVSTDWLSTVTDCVHYSVYTTLAVVSMDWLSTVTDCVPTCIALVRHTRAVNIMSV